MNEQSPRLVEDGHPRNQATRLRHRDHRRTRPHRGAVLRPWLFPALPWAHRPQAAALLAAVASGERPFDAVVVGEYERAFHGDQLPHINNILAAHNVRLWLPETNGPLDLDSPTNQALMRRQSLPAILARNWDITAGCGPAFGFGRDPGLRTARYRTVAA